VSEIAEAARALPQAGALPARPPHFVIEPGTPFLGLQLRELWESRELLWFLVWRDLKVRYRQTALGALWAVLQPLLAMVIFTVIFGRFARMPSDGVPYPLFTFAALLPWNVFSGALTRMTGSVVQNANLISKVYFPRVLTPLSALGSSVVDFGFSLLVFVVLMLAYGVAPTWRVLAVPALLLMTLMITFGIGLWCAALNVRYRDVAYVVPFVTQIWLYASPVAYSTQVVPADWRWLYALNPLVGVIEGFRWVLVGTAWPPIEFLWPSLVITAAAAVTGLMFFQRTESSFADVV
jgi:lipopolysaccharide transport system permease protein